MFMIKKFSSIRALEQQRGNDRNIILQGNDPENVIKNASLLKFKETSQSAVNRLRFENFQFLTQNC